MENKLNVLILGVDSVSRNHFYRQMPKTLRYLQNDLNAIEYLGYQRVGDNTFPNLIPVLTGKHIEELTNCWPTITSRFDKCDFIWNKFHKNGYATVFAEEEAWMGLFNYEKRGFINQQTTHSWNSFSLEIGNNLGDPHAASPCLNERPAIEYLFDYTLKFINAYKNYGQNIFGIFWESSLTHDAIIFNDNFDSTYLKHLENINKTGILNNTILFFMSDHGYRYGGLVKTYNGRADQNLPFLYVVLPKWFKKLYPKATKNIQENTKKLTSHFDLHETLKDIADNNFIDVNNYTRGISLFQNIPENRTCDKAGIPAHFCNCQSREFVETTKYIIIKVSDYIVEVVNSLLEEYKQCGKLYLNKITDARLFEEVFEDVLYKYYTVTLVVEPSNAIFEATVRCSNCSENDFQIEGPITRLNLYGTQSRCINDAKLKLYCYCQ